MTQHMRKPVAGCLPEAALGATASACESPLQAMCGCLFIQAQLAGGRGHKQVWYEGRAAAAEATAAAIVARQNPSCAAVSSARQACQQLSSECGAARRSHEVSRRSQTFLLGRFPHELERWKTCFGATNKLTAGFARKGCRPSAAAGDHRDIMPTIAATLCRQLLNL